MVRSSHHTFYLIKLLLSNLHFYSETIICFLSSPKCTQVTEFLDILSVSRALMWNYPDWSRRCVEWNWKRKWCLCCCMLRMFHWVNTNTQTAPKHWSTHSCSFFGQFLDKFQGSWWWLIKTFLRKCAISKHDMTREIFWLFWFEDKIKLRKHNLRMGSQKEANERTQKFMNEPTTSW